MEADLQGWKPPTPPPAGVRALLREASDQVTALAFGRQVDASPVNPLALRHAAAVHGVGPLLGLRAEEGETLLDEGFTSWLREQLANNRARLTSIREILDALLRQFHRDRIDIVPLKGAALLLEGVEQLAWRAVGDIDLLVAGASPRAIDLAVAHAGYCLKRATWKHRVYVPCTTTPMPNVVGEHPGYPITIEVHPAVEEMFRGSRWDFTPIIREHLRQFGDTSVPDERAMALHLAIHASIATVEGLGRAIQLVDLDRALAQMDADWLISAVQRAGLRHHARFVFPSVALTARETRNPSAVEIAAALRPFVPPGMVSWAERVSLYDVCWLGLPERSTLDRASLWAHDRRDRIRMIASTLLPSPGVLASETWDGEGPLAVLGWYPRYYGKLIRRMRHARRPTDAR